MYSRREKREKKIFMMAAVCALVLISAVCASGTGLTVLADSGYVTFSTSGYRTGENDAGGTITGSFTDGTEISLDSRFTVESGAEFTATAEAADGYVFAGWKDSSGSLLSLEEEYTGQASDSEDYTVEAVFVPDDAAEFYVEEDGDDILYCCLDLALDAAGEDGTVIQYRASTTPSSTNTTGTVYGFWSQSEITVPEGVTLLLPYSRYETEIGENFGEYDNTELSEDSGTNLGLEPEEGNWFNLTVLSGTTLTVEGALILGGQLNAQANTPCAATYGYHANLYLEGDLIVASGGVLSVCGYILGEGMVSCLDGSTVYQPYVVLDFRGGSYTTATAGASGGSLLQLFASSYLLAPQSGEEYVMPFNRYTVQNIQADFWMESGAVLKVYADLYANSQHNTAVGIMIGDAENTGIITLAEGATLLAEYDASTAVSSYSQVGRTSLTITGGASLGSFSLKIPVLGAITYTLQTSNFLFSIPYNYSISLEGEGSVYTLNYGMALLPGATLTVGEGATLNVESLEDGSAVLLVYDGLEDYTAVSSSVTYSSSHTTGSLDYPVSEELQAAGLSASGELIVNGTLNITSDYTDYPAVFAGLVQTTSSYEEDTGTGPILTVGENATLSYTAQVGAVGVANSYSYSGATVYALTGEIMDANTGARTALEAGRTYYGIEYSGTTASFTFTLYDSASSTTSCTTYTEEISQAVAGAWWDTTATVHSVSSGIILSTRTGYFLSGVDLTGCGYYSDLECTEEISSVAQGDVVYESLGDSIVARLESGSEISYFRSLESAVAAADEPGDVVVLMKDLTEENGLALTGTVEIAEGQDLTLYLYDYATEEVWDIEFTETAFDCSGTAVLLAGEGASLSSDTGAALVQVQEGGELALNLNGASVSITEGSASGSGSGLIVNDGTLTLSLGGGSLTADRSGSFFVNSGTLSVDLEEGTIRAELEEGCFAENSGTLALEGGTVSVVLAEAGLVENSGTLTLSLEGGTVSAELEEGSLVENSGAMVLSLDSSSGSIAVSSTDDGAEIQGFVNTGSLTLSLDGGSFSLDASGDDAVLEAIDNSGSMSLELGGGTFRVSASGDDAAGEAMENSGTLEVDLGGGSIAVSCSDSKAAASQAIYNSGTLTLEDSSVSSGAGGTVSFDGVSTKNFGTTGSTESFAAVIRSEGEDASLSLSHVSLEETQSTSNHYSAGVVNYDGSTVEAVTDVDITVPSGYALCNLGGTVEEIQGGTWSGYYGILNMNIVSGSASTTSSYALQSEGRIENLEDTSVTASYRYALLNFAAIGTIGGTASFSAPTYTVYNHYSWYKYSTTTSTSSSYISIEDEGLVRTYVYEGDSVPTIEKISGEVSLEATSSSYALYNLGNIGSISGSSGENPITITSETTYAFYVGYGGCVEEISGNVTIQAQTKYALYVGGNRIVGREATYTDSIGGTLSLEVYTYQASRIGSISGDMDGSGITILAKGSSGYSSSNTYAMEIYGEVGDISGKVSISAYQYALMLESGGTTVSQTTTYYEEGGYSDVENTDVEWDEKEVIEYTYSMASVGQVGGTGDDEITLEVYTNYAIRCNGMIESLGSGTTVKKLSGSTSTSYPLVEVGSSTPAVAYTVTYYLDRDDYAYEEGYTLTRYEATYTYDAEEHPAGIGSIDGAVIIAASDLSGLDTSDPSSVTLLSNYVLRNYGTIGSITDSVIWGNAYVLVNHNTGSYDGDRTTVSYYLAESDTYSTSTSYQVIASLSLSYDKAAPSIGEIDGCSICSSAGYAVYNGGEIGTITGSTLEAGTMYAICNGYSSWYGSQSGYTVSGLEYVPEYDDSGTLTGYSYTRTATATLYEETVINCIGWGNTIAAGSGVAVYNRGSIGTIGGEQTGEYDTVSTIHSETTYGISNYSGVYTAAITEYETDEDGTTSYNVSDGPDIGLISNVEVSGATCAIYQGGDATFSANGNAYIGELGDGLVAWTTSTSKSYYAVGCSTSYASSIGLISGGDYRHGLDSRTYTVYGVDDQTYPEGCYMSHTTESVTLSDGTTENGFYYVTSDGLTLRYEGGDNTEGSMDDQVISLEDTEAAVTVSASGFTKSGSGWTFLGWAVEADAAEPDLIPETEYTVAELVEILESALAEAELDPEEIQDGSRVTLYAVWEYTETISATIEWGSLNYVYTEAEITWNGKTLQYEMQEGVESGWAAEETGESDTLAAGTIRITNSTDSTSSIAATVKFTDTSGFGLTMSYTEEDEAGDGSSSGETGLYSDPFTISTLGSGENLTLCALLSGTPVGSGDHAPLGTLTVTLEKAE